MKHLRLVCHILHMSFSSVNFENRDCANAAGNHCGRQGCSHFEFPALLHAVENGAFLIFGATLAHTTASKCTTTNPTVVDE